jgi:hypothetical protein
MTSAMLAPRKMSTSRPADSAARKTEEPTKPTVKPTAVSRASRSTQNPLPPCSGKAGMMTGKHSAASAMPRPMRTWAGTF